MIKNTITKKMEHGYRPKEGLERKHVSVRVHLMTGLGILSGKECISRPELHLFFILPLFI